jgi:hypothetical protein
MAGRTLVDCRAAVGRGKDFQEKFLFYRIPGPTPDVIAQEYAVSGKAMELLKEIVPRVTRVAVAHR